MKRNDVARSDAVRLVTRSDDGYVAITLRVMSGTLRDPWVRPTLLD